MRAGVGIAAAAILIAGCSTTIPGTGWSRANDLSVYAAMGTFARTAQEHEMLCQGFDVGRVRARWDDAYGARHDAVTQALAARHGQAAVVGREAPRFQRIACGTYPDDNKWRLSYARLLRLLETRLSLAGGGA